MSDQERARWGVILTHMALAYLHGRRVAEGRSLRAVLVAAAALRYHLDQVAELVEEAV